MDDTKQTELMKLFIMVNYPSKQQLKELVKTLDINAKDFQGKTVMHYAAYYMAQPDFINYLAENGADINARDKQGRTPLHDHADSPYFNEGTLSALLHNKANPLALDKKGQIPLKLAEKHVRAHFDGAIQMLAKATKEAEDKKYKTIVKQRSWYLDNDKRQR